VMKKFLINPDNSFNKVMSYASISSNDLSLKHERPQIGFSSSE
jgi:hypothetical protein